MVAISSAGTSAPSIVPPSVHQTADAGLRAYRAEWGALPSTPGGTTGSVGAATTATVRSDPASVHAHAHAQLAADVYNDTASPPAGYRVATSAELEHLGLDPDQLDPGTDAFRARVYASDTPGEDFVIAFRGSQSGADWLSNAQQGIGLDSEHYARALEIGRAAARSDASFVMTGHSLGGGLASTAGIASGSPADTFNAAGLHGDTIADATTIATAAGRGSASVDNYRVPNEILTALQEGGDRVVGGILGTVVSGGWGGAAGVALADLPEAYGTQHELPDVRPEGVNWFEGLNVIDRHSMDWVLAGTAALR